jgi:hypothetical protein
MYVCACVYANQYFSDIGRTLTEGGYDDVIGMTDESCIAYCNANGYIYAGTEYFHECCK